MKSRLVLFMLLLAIVAAYGCSAKPTEQLTRTEKSMQDAKANYADQFAADTWSAGQKAYNDALGRIEQGKYGDANMLLLKAKTSFDKANETAKSQREATEREIKGIQTAAEGRCQQLKQAVTDNTKKLASRKQTLDETIKEVEEKLAKVTTQLNNGQFQDAKYLAGTTLRQVWEAQQEVDSVLKGKKTS